MTACAQIEKSTLGWVELFLDAFMIVFTLAIIVSWAVIVHGHLDNQRYLPRNHGSIPVTGELGIECHDLSWVKGYGSVWNFCPWNFRTAIKNSPTTSVFLSWNRAEIFYHRLKDKRFRLLQGAWAGQNTAIRPPREEGYPHAIYSDVWPVGKTGGNLIDLVRQNHSLQLLMTDDGVYCQSHKSKKSDPHPDTADNVEIPRLGKLLCSTGFFFSVSIFVVGVRLNSYGVYHCIFSFTAIGGIAIVVGTVVGIGSLLVLLSWQFALSLERFDIRA